MSEEPGFIVCGVDGSARSREALRFALAEARRTGETLELVTVWGESFADGPVWPLPATESPDEPQDQDQAEVVQQRVVGEVLGSSAPDVTLARRVVLGQAGPALVAAARGARLLVVGSRSLGPVRAALLGSVSTFCAQHADCAVVVVPGPEHSYARPEEHQQLVAPVDLGPR